MRVLIAALALLAAFPARGVADVRALGVAGAGPAVVGDRVLWGAGDAVLSSGVLAGDVVRVGTVGGLSSLAAGSSLVAAVGGSSVFVSSAAGFTRLEPGLGDGPPFPVVPAVQVSSLGVVTLEDGDVFVRRAGGGRSAVALPPGADPEHAAVAGGLGVAPVPEGALVVFDLRSGIEQRQISVGALDPVNPDGLAVGVDGSVAATLPVGDGTGVLVWSPPGSDRARVLARGVRLGRVAVAGGLVAFVSGEGLREGVRVVVMDAASGRVLMRGPAVVDVSSLSLDGRVAGFATPSCLLLLSGAGSSSRLPGGPCARTEVGAERVVGSRTRVRVACINAPGRSCRVRVGRAAARVRRGSARVISGRGALVVRVVDPDGRARVVARL